ncbi:MAG: hypothetical protein ACXVB4_18810 [Pseudobdellovibrionaceae bacterium]
MASNHHPAPNYFRISQRSSSGAKSLIKDGCGLNKPTLFFVKALINRKRLKLHSGCQRRLTPNRRYSEYATIKI